MKTKLSDNINPPLVSICVPAYNCGKYIGETLSCLCSQTYTNIEIIVVNDGATDETLKNASSNSDHRISIINVVNGGASKARNIAYQHAAGRYIVFFDADDYIESGFIDQQLQKINNSDDEIVLAAWGRFYNNNRSSFRAEPMPFSEMTFDEWINHYWYNGNPMTTPGRAMIPKKVIEAAGLWNEELTLNDDLEFFTRIFSKSTNIIFNHNAIFYYRSGVEGLSSAKSTAAYLSLYKSVILATDLALKHFDNNNAIKKSCANLLQSMVYEVYPYSRELSRLAEEKINELGGSTIAFVAGGYTKLMVSLIGWKLTKIIKTSLSGNK
ncbi:hypothetical protein BH09BAC6_BH09BAC6_01360 [soil metagenome]